MSLVLGHVGDEVETPHLILIWTPGEVRGQSPCAPDWRHALSLITIGPLLAGVKEGTAQVTLPCTHPTHSQAGVVPSAKVETALLIHGVVNPRQFGGLGPGALKGVIKEAVIGAAVGTRK